MTQSLGHSTRIKLQNVLAPFLFITIDIFVTNKIAIKISITGPRARGWRRGGGKEEEGGEEGKQQEGGKGGEQ